MQNTKNQIGISKMQNPTPEQVLEMLEIDSASNYDVVASAEESPVYVTDSNNLQFTLPTNRQQRAAAPDHSALLQMLARIKVPGQFFNGCKSELKEHILRDFYKNRNFMFRCRTEKEVDRIRAILGPRYPTDRDNRVLFPIVLEALNQPNTRLTSFQITDHVAELIISFTDTRVEMDGLVTQGSISITNSETGHSSLWIEPVIQIFNGVYIGNRFGDGQTGSRYVHRGTLPTANELREDIENAKRVVQIGIVQYLEAANQRVSTEDAIRYMEDLEAFPKRFSNIIAEEIKDQELILKSELIRRILMAASHLPLIQSLQVRRYVGSYLGVFEDTASRMANLADQL